MITQDCKGFHILSVWNFNESMEFGMDWLGGVNVTSIVENVCTCNL